MAISDNVIRIKRGGNAPPVTITFANVDLTGSAVEMVLTPATGGTPTTIDTADVGLTLALPNGLVWEYTEALAAALPLGKATYVDFWRVTGSVREGIGAGMITVLSNGEINYTDALQIEVPGIQGPPPWVHYGVWAAGTYPAKSSVTHLGSTWLTLVETAEEPGGGTDWEVLAAAGQDGGIGPTGPAGPTVAPTLIVTEAASFAYVTATHLNRIVNLTSSTAQTITLPSGPALGEGLGCVQWGDGRYQFVAGANAQVHHAYGYSKTTAKYAVANAIVTEISGGITHWTISGELAP